MDDIHIVKTRLPRIESDNPDTTLLQVIFIAQQLDFPATGAVKGCLPGAEQNRQRLFLFFRSEQRKAGQQHFRTFFPTHHRNTGRIGGLPACVKSHPVLDGLRQSFRRSIKIQGVLSGYLMKNGNVSQNHILVMVGSLHNGKPEAFDFGSHNDGICGFV